jgi:hypothetical protein
MWPYYHIPADITAARLLVSEGPPPVSIMKQSLTLWRGGGCFARANWLRGGPNVLSLRTYSKGVIVTDLMPYCCLVVNRY